MICRIALIGLLVTSAPAVAEEGNEPRFELVGSIATGGDGDSEQRGIVVLRDSQSKRTIPVEIGKVFAVEGEVFRVLRLDGNTAVLSDGAKLSTVERGSQVASFGAPSLPPPEPLPVDEPDYETSVAQQPVGQNMPIRRFPPPGVRRPAAVRQVFGRGRGGAAPQAVVSARPDPLMPMADDPGASANDEEYADNGGAIADEFDSSESYVGDNAVGTMDMDPEFAEGEQEAPQVDVDGYSAENEGE